MAQYIVKSVIADFAEKGISEGDVIEMSGEKADNFVEWKIIKEFNLEDEEIADKQAKALDDKVEKDSEAVAESMYKRLLGDMGDVGRKYLEGLQAEQKKKELREKRFKCLGENVQGIMAAMGYDFKGSKGALANYKAITGQSESVNADGGFLVDTDFDKVIDSRLMETNILFSRCDNRNISAGSNGMKWNGLSDYDRTDTNHPTQVYYAAEGDAYTASKWAIEQLTMDLLKLIGLNYLTDELLQDTINLEEDVISWFANEFGWKIDNGIFEGGGGAAITGVLGHASNVAVTRAGAGAVVVADVQNINSRFWTRSKQNAGSIWTINPDVAPSLNSMTLGDQPIYLPPGGVSGAPFGRLLGKSVVEFEHCKSLGTLGDINLLDMSQYRTIAKAGMEILRSEHVRFLNGEEAIRFTKRVNGKPSWTTVQTPQNGTNTVSPFVSLAT